MASLILILVVSLSSFAFHPHAFLLVNQQNGRRSGLNSIAVPVSELEESLTPSEKSVTSVVRGCGPSVAFVTSVLPIAMTQRRGTRTPAPSTGSTTRPPQGQGLGSGSGFCVDTDGYIVTNYHVIERAFQMTKQLEQAKTLRETWIGNVTKVFPVLGNAIARSNSIMPIPFPQVYVRINSGSQYQQCRIVNVAPELDVAVLKIINTTTNATKGQQASMSFGTSNTLLVGQTVVAIGNPFGLDQAVTTGVVSALDRDIFVSSNKPIRNCIQTDASINPGNSGGPLLNLNGKIIGMNTAIVSTSGSSAGIGFAVPSDKMAPVVKDFIRNDKAKHGFRPKMGYLGVSIVKGKSGNWIHTVMDDSPAAKGGLVGIDRTYELMSLGDSIIAIGGNAVMTLEELEHELQTRVQGEEITLTILNSEGERRIAYIKLGSKP